jgi:transcriptional regulator with XRE-family HTH domain
LELPALSEFDPIYLREWRKAKGLTLIELARLAGIDHGNLSRLERGIFPYSQSVLEKLAAALDTGPAIILTFTPAEAAKIEAEIAGASAGSIPLTKEAWQKICNMHKKP